MEGTNCKLFVYVENADITYQKALNLGAMTIMGLSDRIMAERVV